MKRVEPKVYLIGETKIVTHGMQEFLYDIGVPDWNSENENKSIVSDIEAMIEFYGRACYNSFEAGLNANVTKITEGNDKYLANIIKHMHGSVTEHAIVNFMMTNVSRVFTHELVRHRVGVAISQESLRFVRLTDLKLFLPSVIKERPKMVQRFEQYFKRAEEAQLEMAKEFGLDDPDVDFEWKKTVTSAMRRIAPMGLGTVIGWSANIRTLRWLLENRTSRHAEEEIRIGFNQVAEIVIERYPNLFFDFKKEMVKGHYEWVPEYSKI